MTTSHALKNLWWTTVFVLSFLAGLLLVRLLYWPPDVGAGTSAPPNGIFKFLGFLAFMALIFIVWQYALKPFAVVFLGKRRTKNPKACCRALIKHSLASVGILLLPTAGAIAFEFPDPFDIIPIGLVYAAVWYVSRNTTSAVQKIQAECDYAEVPN